MCSSSAGKEKTGNLADGITVYSYSTRQIISNLTSNFKNSLATAWQHVKGPSIQRERNSGTRAYFIELSMRIISKRLSPQVAFEAVS